MANQPPNPSTITPDPLAQFKSDVKAWLRQRKLSIVWLADKLQYAPGSVKNWFYGKISIPEEKRQTILQILENYEKGQPKQSRTQPRANAYPRVGIIAIIFNDRDGIPTPNFPLWGAALGVSPAFFQIRDDTSDRTESRNSATMEKFTEWATRTLMDTAAAAIQAEIEKIKGDSSINDVDTLSLLMENYTFDGKSMLTDTPFRDNLGRLRPHMELSNPSASVLYIPVLYDEWEGLYAELAASISGQSTHAWIVKTLNAAAPSASVQNLQSFLTQRLKPTEAS